MQPLALQVLERAAGKVNWTQERAIVEYPGSRFASYWHRLPVSAGSAASNTSLSPYHRLPHDKRSHDFPQCRKHGRPGSQPENRS